MKFTDHQNVDQHEPGTFIYQKIKKKRKKHLKWKPREGRTKETGQEKRTLPLASSRESTGGAAALLQMEAAAATPHAEGVGLVPPLTETSCSLTLLLISIQQKTQNKG